MDSLIALTGGAPASAILLATIVVTSLAGLFLAPGLIARNVLRPHGLVERGDYATLVTSGFIHADLAHLLFNGFTFWAFGFGLERRLGTLSFIALYTLGLLASSIATWLIHRRQPRYASLGAGKRFRAHYGATYPMVFDQLGDTAAPYGVFNTPETLFVDRRGRIVNRILGPVSADSFDQAVRRALAT